MQLVLAVLAVCYCNLGPWLATVATSIRRSLNLRNDLLTGFAEAVAEFEDWVPLLVLRAVQSLGMFTRPGAAATPEQLRSAGGIIPQYSRFTAEMLAILQRAGSAACSFA